MSSRYQATIAHGACGASSYGHLLELDRAGWAWEWLRRNPSFAAAYSARAFAGEACNSIVVPSDLTRDDLLQWGLHHG